MTIEQFIVDYSVMQPMFGIPLLILIPIDLIFDLSNIFQKTHDGACA